MYFAGLKAELVFGSAWKEVIESGGDLEKLLGGHDPLTGFLASVAEEIGGHVLETARTEGAGCPVAIRG